MEEIYTKTEKGTVLLITFIVLGILLLLGSYFLTFTLSELRISKSHEAGAQTYYLAEAGINEAIWKLKNNPDWKNKFETDPDWSPDDFSSDFGGGRYTVSVENLECGRAKINTISTLPVSGGTAQRIVKTEVFRALGSITDDSAVFTAGASKNIVITDSQVTIYDGNLYCGNVLHIKEGSIVKVYDNLETEDPNPDDGIIENLEGQVLVGGNILHGQITTSTAICAKNVCTDNCAAAGSACPPEAIGSLPWVDFDEDAENSFEARAQVTYSASGFENLLKGVGDGGTLTLNPDKLPNAIFYITGDVKLKGDRHLVVNGILVVDGDVDIGEEGDDFFQLRINRPPGLDTSPTGLLATGDIRFGEHSSSTDITGVIYTSPGRIFIEGVKDSFTIKGAILARKVNFLYIGPLNITLDNNIIGYGLGHIIDGLWIGPPEFLPTVIIDYWEESY